MFIIKITLTSDLTELFNKSIINFFEGTCYTTLNSTIFCALTNVICPLKKCHLLVFS